jgi:hypothetical protein
MHMVVVLTIFVSDKKQLPLASFWLMRFKQLAKWSAQKYSEDL